MASQSHLAAKLDCVPGIRLAVWTFIALLGLLRLGYPLGGDQALFLSYAMGLDDGARLYVDLWDNKQPGIFWFYLIAGNIFGFTGVGIHLFEWLWVSAAAWILWKAADLSFATTRARELVPLLTIGLYYWWASAWYMGQVEILVGLPLAGCLLASATALSRPSLSAWMHLVFGYCAAVVIAFKLVLVLVPISIWLTLCLFLAKAGHGGVRAFILQMLTPALLGALVPLACIALYFIQSGSWDSFYWTNFVYPRLALHEIEGKELPQLFLGARWLVLMALPVCVFGALKFKALGQEPLRLIEAQALAWLGAGFLAIAVQRFSWWAYHYLLLLPPVGVIACSLIDRFMAFAGQYQATKRRLSCLDPVSLAVVVAMFVITPLNALRGFGAAIAAALSPEGDRLVSFRTALDSRYRERIDKTAFLRDPNARAGAIYVFGDPNWLLQADRAQALPIHGWAWEFMLDQQWAALAEQLRTHRPAYIYLDAGYAIDIERKSPDAAVFIREDYEALVSTSANGIWYGIKASR